VFNNIPCLDIGRQTAQLKNEYLQILSGVFDQTAFSSGKFVEAFEASFAAYCDVPYAIGVNSGTSALHLMMIALGITAGDEVIIPADTFIATAWAPSYVGATPVFVDCASDTWNIDPERISERITTRTKAVIGVHLYGQPCDIDALMAICREHNLYFLEDAAQAHGAKYKGKRVGKFGEMAAFSFYPGKNLGACGEGGIITTNNPGYAKHLKRLRNHGSEIRYYHDELGYNFRMDGIQGAILNVKLPYLDQWNARRRQIAEQYRQKIDNPAIHWQRNPDWAEPIYHLFVVTVDDRQSMIDSLNSKGISPGLHYPVPCHLQKAYAHLGYKPGDCPNAEYLADHCLSLPMFPEMTDEEVERVIEAINAC